MNRLLFIIPFLVAAQETLTLDECFELVNKEQRPKWWFGKGNQKEDVKN